MVDQRDRCRHTGFRESPRRAEDRVAREVSPDLDRRTVRRLHVGPGVGHEPDGAQVQECRCPLGPDPGDGVGRHLRCRHGVESVRLEPAQVGPVPVGGSDPARRGAHADAEAVVFAHEQEREGKVLVCDAARGVDRPGGGRVVGRCVAEAAHRDGVVGPGRRDTEPARPIDAERHPDGPWQVGGDRRGLRDHRQVGVAEDLVAAAGHGLLGGRDQAEQYVPARVVARHLHGPADVEPSCAIVQQGRIARAQRCRYRRVGLVTGRADGVVALAPAPQPARRQVQVPARDLRLEQRQCVRSGQAPTRPQRAGGIHRCGGRERAQRVEQVLVERQPLLAARAVRSAHCFPLLAARAVRFAPCLPLLAARAVRFAHSTSKRTPWASGSSRE